jgi:hypothetical protein
MFKKQECACVHSVICLATVYFRAKIAPFLNNMRYQYPLFQSESLKQPLPNTASFFFKLTKLVRKRYSYFPYLMVRTVTYVVFLYFSHGTGGIFYIFYVLYSTLLHLPPPRYHCVGGCWARTQLRLRH